MLIYTLNIQRQYVESSTIKWIEIYFIFTLNRIKPEAIVVGMGYPYQEQFLIKCKESLNYEF